MSTKFIQSVRSNLTIDLKALVKLNCSQEYLAKHLKMTRQQVNHILNNPDQITIERLNQILSILNYKLELRIDKI